uniref:outer membrane beta-barrel protein n=1 Tax=Bacteroides thetaiotaomicron TaxID=818 RepID=UPI00359CA021
MRTILTILIAFLATFTYAQKNQNTVSGYVYTLERNGNLIPLSYSSVSILQLPDSVFIAGSATNKKGYFEIKYTKQKGNAKVLKVSYTGMLSQYYTLKQIDNEVIDSIFLHDEFVLLNEVFIIAKQPEIQQKRDTTIINAKAFTVPQNAYLQELIKRVPGITYDAENNRLSYNGKVIQEIDVNGEPFFNQDIQMALNNLPAKFISTIRVYNKKDNSLFKYKNNEYYILDLQTKEEFNGSLLNSVKAGYGTQKKKDFEGQVNYFKKNGDNLSLILRSTNKDLNSFYNDNISHSAGLNVFHKFNDKINIAGNMQYIKNKIGEQSKNYLEQYLQNSTLYSLGIAKNENKNKSIHSFIGVEWKPNEKTSLLFNIGYNYNTSNTINYNTTDVLNHSINSIKTDANHIPKEYKINTNIYELLSINKSHHFTWQAMACRDISKHIRLDFNLQYNQNKGKNINFTNSTINYYQLKNNANKDSVFYSRQYIYSPLENTAWNTSLTVSQTISKDFIVSYFYNLDIKKETFLRNTYNLSVPDDYDMDMSIIPPYYEQEYLDSLSNNSYSKSYTHNMGLRLNYNSKQWNINASLVYAPLRRSINQQTGTNKTDTVIYSTDFQSSISANWHKDNLDIVLYYNGVTNQPPLLTLLPVTNMSNPLNIIKGNPNLERTFIHSINLDFRGFKGIYASTRYQTITNDIAQKITYNAITGVRESYPVNINGNWNINTNIVWNKTLGDFRLSLNENALYREQISLLGDSFNAEPNRSKTHDFDLFSKFQLAYQPKWGNIELLGEHHFKQYRNSLQENYAYSRDYKIKLNGVVNLPWDIQIANDISYTYRNGTAIDKNNNTEILWNLALTWLFLKDKSAEVSFYWADILKQRKSYIQDVTADSFYEYQTKQVPGYILFSFKYNFNLELKK